MDTYRVAEVGERQGMVWLSCTHQREAREILAELQELFPDWRVGPHKEYVSEFGDETGWLVDKCRGRHRFALWWLVRQLCARDWEPFAFAHDPSREATTGPVYVFRRRGRRELEGLQRASSASRHGHVVDSRV